jgi:hypothetical protein
MPLTSLHFIKSSELNSDSHELDNSQYQHTYVEDCEMSNEEADQIASLVLEQFDKLPAKRKPAVRDNGIQEWVPLSGIVAKGLYSYIAIYCTM